MAAMPIYSSRRLIIGKKLKTIFFSENMRPTAYIFSMYQCLVVPYINPANQALGLQTGHTTGGHIFKQRYIAKELYTKYSPNWPRPGGH